MICVTDEAARVNVAYLQQFVKRGTPRRLPEDERRALAMILQVDERLLGARDPWTPEACPASPGGAKCSRSEG